ncbi:MAG: hypothetical protein GF411_17300 [Candidatus Lokiarchaeota archaeon]|nr:hypothetical protein [Candidatus Lokiarchaeota archaeon]
MSQVMTITSPWDDLFDSLLSESSSFDFLSPFITQNGVEYVTKYDLKIRGVTVLSPLRFVKGVSDIESINNLLNIGAEMKSINPLHAKVYIFDNRAVVTSANLTLGGLVRNQEYGLLVSDDRIVRQVRRDFDYLFSNGANVDTDTVESIRRLLERIPPDLRFQLEQMDSEQFIERSMIIESLVGWNKEVYKIISQFTSEVFTLQDLYDYVEHFSRLYPDNRNIKGKIRQILQQLRDFGLLEFVDNRGTYRRLVQ